MSILPLFLLVGVATAKYTSSYGNADTFQPIVTASQARRICAALCINGLGGKACGDDCLDIIPTSLPIQSVNGNRSNGSEIKIARTDICPVLCANKLGYPLCNCSTTDTANANTVDYVQICGNVCVNLNYRIPGCQSCKIYKAMKEMHGDNSFSLAINRSVKSVDWEEWCRQMCSVGDGGVACNCDILPMSLQID
ncbi:hypothetical protein Trydic_g4190 [Trypoxylus dichotomus]